MSNIYNWSTTAADNATADSGVNWAEGQAPSTVNGSARAMMQRLAQFLDDIGGVGTVGGTADNITLTPGSNITSLANGMVMAFKATANNTGAATLNVNGLGAKALRIFTTAGEAALPASAIRQGGVYLCIYSTAANSSAGGWVVLNPSQQSTTASALLDLIKTVDGAGSGLDADLLDGQHGAYYLAASSVSAFMLTVLDDTTASAARTTLGAAASSHTHTITDCATYVIDVPSSGDYRLAINLPFGGTITSTTTRSAAGTATATFKINSTSLGGSTNSVSTTEQTRAHSSSNTFVAGDDFVVTLSSVGGTCARISITITFTRTI